MLIVESFLKFGICKEEDYDFEYVERYDCPEYNLREACCINFLFVFITARVIVDLHEEIDSCDYDHNNTLTKVHRCIRHVIDPNLNRMESSLIQLLREHH